MAVVATRWLRPTTQSFLSSTAKVRPCSLDNLKLFDRTNSDYIAGPICATTARYVGSLHVLTCLRDSQSVRFDMPGISSAPKGPVVVCKSLRPLCVVLVVLRGAGAVQETIFRFWHVARHNFELQSHNILNHATTRFCLKVPENPPQVLTIQCLDHP